MPLLWLLTSWWKRPRASESLGRRGEFAAAEYLRAQGFRIITMNRRAARGEIDIIAVEGEFLVFVEVRTRESEAFMKPEMSIREEKRRAVLRTVRRLVRKHKTVGLTPRIDVIAIIWPKDAEKPSSIRHYRSALSLPRW